MKPKHKKVHWKMVGHPKVFCGAESLSYDISIYKATCERCRSLAKLHGHLTVDTGIRGERG